MGNLITWQRQRPVLSVRCPCYWASPCLCWKSPLFLVLPELDTCDCEMIKKEGELLQALVLLALTQVTLFPIHQCFHRSHSHHDHRHCYVDKTAWLIIRLLFGFASHSVFVKLNRNITPSSFPFHHFHFQGLVLPHWLACVSTSASDGNSSHWSQSWLLFWWWIVDDVDGDAEDDDVRHEP